MFKRLLKSIIGWLREIPPTGYDEILPEEKRIVEDDQ